MLDSGQYVEGAHAHKIVQPLSFLGGSKSCESFSICRISSLKQSAVVEAERKIEKERRRKKSQSTRATKREKNANDTVHNRRKRKKREKKEKKKKKTDNVPTLRFNFAEA